MRLSFAIPAYNEELTIGGCLESILEEIKGKNYDIEIIVVNNASIDRTKEVALTYPGVKVLDEHKKGITWARQAGSMAATGELIANIDADTRLPKGWINKVFLEFAKNEKMVALSGPHIYYDLSKLAQFNVSVFYYFGYISHLINQYIFKTGAMIQGGNFILKRATLEKIGWYNGGSDFYEDTYIAGRIFKEGDVKFTFDLPIYASGRRFKKNGMLLAGAEYAINYFWVLIFKKPFSKGYIDVRETTESK